MQKKQTVQFAVFGAVMALVHLVQCVLRIKAREVFLRLASVTSQSEADHQLWIQFSNYGKYIEVIYYTICIIFMIIIGYRLIYGKIQFRFALTATVAAYFVPAAIGIIFHYQVKGVSNFLTPVVASFLFALLIIISAGVKRYQYKKASNIAE